VRFRDLREAATVTEADAPECPLERPRKLLRCDLCGYETLDQGEHRTAREYWFYGAWRMSLHKLGVGPGGRQRCAGLPMFAPHVALDFAGNPLAPITEEENDGMGT
jgi:hypothetical protein